MARMTRDALAEQAAANGWDIGEFSYGLPTVTTWPRGPKSKLTIGRYCSIARGVSIFLGGDHRTDWVTTYPFNVLDPEARRFKGHPHSRGDVTIGNDVWLARNVLIVSGVTIGDGACIGANAVVGRSIPPYTVAVGNPATVVKQRFSDAAIARLLALRWWDWAPERIRALYPLMLSNRIEDFLDAAERAAEAFARDAASAS